MQLLIDRNAAAGALIERTRAQGVVVGVGDGMLRMEYVPGTADVKTGDLVVTSGIDGIYPKGFVIGTIDHVDRGAGAYHEIMVRPAVDFSRLEEVLVVLTPPRVARERPRSQRSEERRRRWRRSCVALGAADDAGRATCSRQQRGVDLVLIVVVYVALTSGPVDRAAGRHGGRPDPGRAVERHHRHRRPGQDGGRVPAGVLGTQFIVTAPLPRFLLFVVATVLHAAMFMGLYVLLDLRQFPDAVRRRWPARRSATRVVGVVAFQMIEWLPGLRRRGVARGGDAMTAIDSG